MSVLDFRLSTDQPIDKVIFMTTRSVTISAFGFDDEVIAHGLGFIPLPMGEWSVSSDFSTSNTLGQFPNTLDGPDTSIQADDTNITIRTNNNSGSSITLYYRIYGLMDEAINPDVPFTVDESANIFQLSTDYNYPGLFLSGNTGSVSSGGGQETINHNLGFLPQVRVWHIDSGIASVMAAQEWGFGGWTARVTTTDLIIRNDGIDPEVFHYRIYADD